LMTFCPISVRWICDPLTFHGQLPGWFSD